VIFGKNSIDDFLANAAEKIDKLVAE
jgi:hypothetical protein